MLIVKSHTKSVANVQTWLLTGETSFTECISVPNDSSDETQNGFSFIPNYGHKVGVSNRLSITESPTPFEFYRKLIADNTANIVAPSINEYSKYKTMINNP